MSCCTASQSPAADLPKEAVAQVQMSRMSVSVFGMIDEYYKRAPAECFL
jgi:hypothetical protein